MCHIQRNMTISNATYRQSPLNNNITYPLTIANELCNLIAYHYESASNSFFVIDMISSTIGAQISIWSRRAFAPETLRKIPFWRII